MAAIEYSICFIGGVYLDRLDEYIFGDLFGVVRLLKEGKGGNWYEIYSQNIGTDIWSLGYDRRVDKLYIGGSKLIELTLPARNARLFPSTVFCRTLMPNGTINNRDC